MKKKAILIPNLLGGGAERVASDLYKALKFDYFFLFERKIKYDISNQNIISLEVQSSSNLLKKNLQFYIAL
jgi:hypothetical protein